MPTHLDFGECGFSSCGFSRCGFNGCGFSWFPLQDVDECVDCLLQGSLWEEAQRIVSGCDLTNIPPDRPSLSNTSIRCTYMDDGNWWRLV